MLTLTRAVFAAVAVGGCGGSSSRPAQPPPCPEGDARVVTAAQLEALAGCDVIAGDLVIDGAAVRDIAALGRVTEIRGSLVVGPTLRLTSLAGLRNLRSVSKNIDVHSNAGLTGVFFGRLATVGGDLEIDRNRSAAIASLHQLQSVGGDVEVSGNTSLLRLDLASLETVGGDLVVVDNRRLEDLVLGDVAVAGERSIEPGAP